MVPASETPRWRGVNHLALVTPDMDATVRFYAGVLGMRVVATTRAGPMRHYFFEIGPENTVAFFEIDGIGTFAKPAGAPPSQTIQFDHLSFNLPDERGLLDLRQRLLDAGCECTEVVENGIALEASWWAIDATGRPADYADERVFADPEPVPAVDELRRHGQVLEAPVTRLTSDEIVDPV